MCVGSPLGGRMKFGTACISNIARACYVNKLGKILLTFDNTHIPFAHSPVCCRL